jgi:hypothetical protein
MPGETKTENGITYILNQNHRWELKDQTAQTPQWKPPQQKRTSAATSINKSKVPAVFSAVSWKPGTVNADIGGGRYDTATDYLKTQGVENLIYDPFNRSEEHNQQVVSRLTGGQADTATVSNVLNVIQEPENRSEVISQASQAINDTGSAYFTFYKGKGEARATAGDSWQENRKAESYVAEIQKHFSDVQRKGPLVIAKQPIRSSAAAQHAKPNFAYRYFRGGNYHVQPEDDGLVITKR